MIIEPLADHTDLLPVLAGWYGSQWEPYYGQSGPGDAKKDLDSRCNRDKLPIGLVAIENDQLCGTVALDFDTATNLTPSVVGLLVASDFRRQGVASALLNSAEDLALQFAYDKLYISTTMLDDFLMRQGWQPLGDVTFMNNERGSVYWRMLAS